VPLIMAPSSGHVGATLTATYFLVSDLGAVDHDAKKMVQSWVHVAQGCKHDLKKKAKRDAMGGD
jgi:hypothetical protein